MRPAVGIMRADLPKPAYGAACNGCGACCSATICPTGQRVLGLGERQAPCPALTAHEGAYRCGLVLNPQRWRPAQEAIYGAERMRRSILRFIGVGTGCDCRLVTEPRNPEYEQRLDSRPPATHDEVAEFVMTWNLWGQP